MTESMGGKLGNFKRKIKKLFLNPYYFILNKWSHEDYARKLGVNAGKNLHVYGNVSWGTEPWIITLGDNVHITSDCRFVTHDGATLLFRNIEPTLELTRPIVVGNDVYIGARSTIMGGVTIGNKVIIGAGAVVTHDIPDNSVAVGVPAKVIKTADEYFEKAKKESLGLGNLKYEEKDKALKEYYHYTSR